MKKSALPLFVGLLAISASIARADNPLVKLREKKAAEKAKERADKEDPRPKPVAEPSHHDKDRGKERDRNRNRDHRNRDDWNRPRTVIIERPVYIPAYPGSYPNGRYDSLVNREAALLEEVAKQMRFALRENEVLKPFKLDTDTVGDSVEIEGQVDSIEQLQLALDVARKIDQSTRIVVTRIKIRQK